MLADPPLISLPHLSTEGLGKIAFHYSEVTSTQDILKTLYKKNASHGTLVFADRQRKGRGRLGKTWISLPGTHLLFSLLLFPKLPWHQMPILNIAAAVAWVQILEKRGLSNVRIKWPNDVLVQNKKIAGILAECVSPPQDPKPAIMIGMGLNIDCPRGDFPKEIQSSATCISQHSPPPERIELLVDYLNEFEALYQRIHRQGSGEIQTCFHNRWAFSGQPISIYSGETHVGRSWDIDPDGALLLQDSNQKTFRILSGSVELLSSQRGKV